MAEKKGKNIDIWLVGVILVLVMGFGGGLWMVNKSVHARLDQIYIRTDSKLSQLRSEVFSFGNQVHTLNLRLKKILKSRSGTTAVPAAAAKEPSKPAAPKKK